MKRERLHRAEIIVLALTVACALFTAGFFVGRSTAGSVVTVQRLSGAPSTQPSRQPAPSPPPAGSPLPASDGKAAPDTMTDAGAGAEAKININTAALPELESLPGIGQVLAGRIISYREQNGGFKAVDELMNVDGIGQAKFETVRDMITIG
jgi:competence protein ComEA